MWGSQGLAWDLEFFGRNIKLRKAIPKSQHNIAVPYAQGIFSVFGDGTTFGISDGRKGIWHKKDLWDCKDMGLLNRGIDFIHADKVTAKVME